MENCIECGRRIDHDDEYEFNGVGYICEFCIDDQDYDLSEDFEVIDIGYIDELDDDDYDY